MAKEIRKRDAGKTSGSSFVLNLETRGRGNDKNSNGTDQNLEILIGTEVNLDQANKYNTGTVGKQVTLGGNGEVLRRRMKMILQML